MSSDLPCRDVTSSQDFIRALKAVSDPPYPAGPSKIHIASQVWEQSTLYVPNKGQVIVDWILTRLLKGKSKEGDSSPLLDLDHWKLLADIISPLDRARNVNSWLLPLLNRSPIAPTIIAYFKASGSSSSSHKELLSPLFSRCFIALWSLAAPKMSVDVLLDCFGEFLTALCRQSVGEKEAECLQVIGPMIISSYRNAFANTSNKKKIYVSFNTNWLQVWLQFMTDTINNPRNYSSVSDIFAAGIETIFCIDALRQWTETSSSDAALFDSLTKISLSIVVPVLPTLFLSFCQSIRKSKATLFGSKHDSGVMFLEQIRTSGMEFYASCEKFLGSEADLPTEVWGARTALLDIIDQENLYSDRREEYCQLLRNISTLAVTRLQIHKDDTEPVFRTLSALARIDYDILCPSLSAILSIVTKQTLHSAPASATLLNLFLDYHTKTRTVPAYLLAMLNTLDFGHLSGVTPRKNYEAIFAGPVFDLVHLDRLSTSTNKFVTPGQCLELVTTIAGRLENSLALFQASQEKSQADAGDGSRKKRKLDSAMPSQDTSEDAAAICFAFHCRFVGIVLTSIPLHSVADDTKTKIREIVQNLQSSTIRSSLKAIKRIVGKSEGRGLDNWPLEIVVAALLRLQYILTSSSRLGVEPIRNEKLESGLMTILEADEALPELKLEMARFFLKEASKGNVSKFESILGSLFDQIELLSGTESVRWSGRSSTLVKSQEGKAQAGVALLHVLIDRWLPVLDEWGTSKHLKRFVHVLLHLGRERGSPTNDALSPIMIYKVAMHSAEFWELSNVRAALFSYINEETSGLDQVDLLHALQTMPEIVTPTMEIQQSIRAYETLLFAPLEYLTKNVRADMLRRALTADVIISSSSDYDRAQIMGMKTILRQFLIRAFTHSSNVEYSAMCDMTEYLIDSRWIDIESTTDSSMETTLKLIDIHMLALVKYTEKDQAEGLLRIIRRLLQLKAFEPPGNRFEQIVIIRFLDVMIKSSIAKSGGSVGTPLRKWTASLEGQLAQRLLEVTSGHGILDSDLGSNLLIAEAWCKTIILRRSLQITDNMSRFGVAIARKVLTYEALDFKTSHIAQACKSAISVLFAELQDCPAADRENQLQLIVAMHVSLYRLRHSLDTEKNESAMTSSWDLLSVDDFSHIMDFCLELLSTQSTTPEELDSLIHFTSSLLHGAPEGTLKMCQRYTASCLDIFLDLPIFWTETDLKLAVLNLISGACGNRPASIRLGDVSHIWTMLSRLLIGSAKHDNTTSTDMFREIVHIVSALIRLRRDLVLPTLPHLGVILSQLIMIMRSARPQLGGKQSKMVTDTFPSWVNENEPLGLEEAKALARLLTTLTTKSVVRVYGSISEIQKAESLARPFGKHASYVLVAYIEAMNDPLCVVSADIRKELYPGLFALCDMLNDHDREALMLSALDSGGKATMKALWKEYEKQKYVGKG